MSAIRASGFRALRPSLSTRYRYLRRLEHTSAGPTSNPSPNPNFVKRHGRQILFSAVAIALGFSAGNFALHVIAPPKMPEYGTREDAVLIADLNARVDSEFKIKVLRGKCLGVSKQLKGGSPSEGWVEIVPRLGPTQDDVLVGEGMIQQLQGAKGLGVERQFWNPAEKQLISVIWFGGSLCGWPGVTHGGAIATQLTEKLSLAAALAKRNRGEDDDGFSSAAVPQRMPGTGEHAKTFPPARTPTQPDELTLTYKKPTHANSFYVIRVQPQADSPDEYGAELETLDGKICVKAEAKFTPSHSIGHMEEKAVETARRGYTQFRDWMWPSRQKNSQLQ